MSGESKMSLVRRAIFSLPTVRPRTHQQGRQGRQKSVGKVKEGGEFEEKLPSSGEKQNGGEEVKRTSDDGQNGGSENKSIPGKL